MGEIVSDYQICPICGMPNHRDNDTDAAMSHRDYQAAINALESVRLAPATAEGDEAFYDEIRAGVGVDPNRVCSTCRIY